MKFAEASKIASDWKKANADVLKGWEVMDSFTTNHEREVICVVVHASLTKPDHHTPDGCCDTPTIHQYYAQGQYIEVRGDMTDKGRAPITQDQLTGALDALLEEIKRRNV